MVWLGRAERWRAVGQRGGRWLRCLCVSRVGTHPLHLPSALLHARARKRVYIYMRVCAGCACVAPYKHYLHVLDGGGEEDAPDRRLIHTRNIVALSHPCLRCVRVARVRARFRMRAHLSLFYFILFLEGDEN